MSYDYFQSDLSDLDEEVVTAKAVSTTGTRVKKERQYLISDEARAARFEVMKNPEIRAKISKGIREFWANNGTRMLSDETKAKIAAANRGGKRSAETRAKMSATKLARGDAPYAHLVGAPRPADVAKQIRETHRAKWSTNWTVVATGKVYYGTRKLVAEELGLELHQFDYQYRVGNITKQGN